jgi:hypothetical protein
VGIVEDLALGAGSYIWGIPWSKITADPYADVYSQLQYYVPLAEAMREVFDFADQIDWTWDVMQDPTADDASVAWYGVRESMLGKESFLVSALKSGAANLVGDEAPTMDREIFRAFVSQMFSLAMRGFYVHSNLLLQYGGVDPKVIVNNADLIHALCKALRLLWDTGMLNSISKSKSIVPTSGLGEIPPVVIVGIVVGSLAALSVLAWFVIKVTTILAQWQLAQGICAEAAADPTNKEKQRACQQARDAINDAAGGTEPFDIVNTLAMFAGVGILMYVGSLIIPDLLVGLKRARYR